MRIDLGGKLTNILIATAIMMAAGTIIYFENKKDFLLEGAIARYEELMDKIENSIFPFENYRRTTRGYDI
ncbi:hypothetical protein COU59_00885 [Candidatus Pacearchaeota archaeon CG10_big_fil_rev_8_21_14_0_10_34_12]|nr:MAG: hypothetical protein COU59_00885 [Candidatus Pacearchaeota archaeon CG10_big_fil_rev_8_21_14_0_10_34_12]